MDAVPSRSTITNAVLSAAVSISSIMVCSDTSAIMVRVFGTAACLAHLETGLFGSASMMVTAVAPCAASSVARSTAEVDFPTPPFGLAKTIVGIIALARKIVVMNNRYQTGCQQKSGSLRIAVG